MKITRFIIFLLSLFMFSCTKNENDQLSGGPASLMVNFNGVEFDEGQDAQFGSTRERKATISLKSEGLSRSTTESDQLQIPISENYCLLVSLDSSPDENEQADKPKGGNDAVSPDIPPLKNAIARSLEKKAAPKRVEITRTIKYRVVAFRQDGSYYGQKVYTSKEVYPDNESTYWQLDGGQVYKFLIYSLNENVAPPEFNPGDSNAWIEIKSNTDFLYFEKEIGISGNQTNNLDLVFKYRNSKLNITFDSADINTIKSIESNIESHHKTHVFRISPDRNGFEYQYLNTPSITDLTFSNIGTLQPTAEVNYWGLEQTITYHIKKLEISVDTEEGASGRPTSLLRENLDIVVKNLSPGKRINLKLKIVRNILNAVQISAGVYHTLVIDELGDVYGTGYIPYGLGIPRVNRYDYTSEFQNISVKTPGIGSSKLISTGFNSSFIVNNKGELWASGYNNYGELGLGSTTPKYYAFEKVNFTGGEIASITSGKYHTLLLTKDGRVYASGQNNSGQLGLNNGRYQVNTFNLVNSLVPYQGQIESISAGDYHTVVKTKDGRILVAGYSSNYQISSDVRYIEAFTELDFPFGEVKEAKAGEYTTLVVTKAGDLYARGLNSSGQLGLPTGLINNNIDKFTKVPGFSGNVASVSPFREHTLVLTNSGELFGAGQNTYGQIGIEPYSRYVNPFTKINTVPSTVNQVLSSSIAYHSIVTESNGDVYGTGYNTYGLLGIGDYRNKFKYTKLPIKLRN